jgi:hypothetical protein
MKRGKGHAVLVGEADYQSAGALGFLIWAESSAKYNHEICVAIETGFPTGLGAIDNKFLAAGRC